MELLNKDEVKVLIDSNNGDNSPLNGRHIGEVDFTGEVFNRSANFNGVTFTCRALFGHSIFLQEANFKGVTFEKGATFNNAQFRKNAFFNYPKFIDFAYLWKCIFFEAAHFKEISVYKQIYQSPSPYQPGEVNFSWSAFRGEASFSRAQFFGPAYFWRTLFYSKASFDDSIFKSRAWFNGQRGEVLFPKGKLYEPTVVDILSEAGIIRSSGDGDDYVQFNNIRSEEDLISKINDIKILPRDVDLLKWIWNDGAKEMFANPKEVTFRAARFEDEADTQFIGVNVDRKRSIREAGIFISYSHRDLNWLNLILKHIKFLEDNHGFEVWKDEDIKAGEDWDSDIKRTIEKSKVSILLVTRNFVQSQYIMTTEIRMMKEAASNGSKIFWIPIEEINFADAEFSKFQSAHPVSRPLERLNSEELSQALNVIADKLAETLGVIANK